MAQYYQIVGQGPSVTLEELQRYYPNIRLDSIALVNQDDQQYAQQQVKVNIVFIFCLFIFYIFLTSLLTYLSVPPFLLYFLTCIVNLLPLGLCLG